MDIGSTLALLLAGTAFAINTVACTSDTICNTRVRAVAFVGQETKDVTPEIAGVDLDPKPEDIIGSVPIDKN